MRHTAGFAPTIKSKMAMRAKPSLLFPFAAIKFFLILMTVISAFMLRSGHQAGGQEQGAVKSGQRPLDPQAWGSNHVGKPIPDFVQGDECLFCHRNNIGPSWPKNSHALTVRERQAAPDVDEMVKGQPALGKLASQIEFFLGSRHYLRFLKKDGYGKFSLLKQQAVLNADHRIERLTEPGEPAWDKDKFADRCAGCHATAVDPKTKAFSEFSLDCYTCHGNVDLEHTGDTSRVLLSKKRRNDAKVITSLCAQCHLRDGSSKSTGLPYPNSFVAGDNLFRDFIVKWERADDRDLNEGDRHVWRNVRDVMINGEESITCVSCHQVHANTSIRHRRILRAPICSECHQGAGFKDVKRYTVHSSLCEY